MPLDAFSLAYRRLLEAQRSYRRAKKSGDLGAHIAAALECGSSHLELNELDDALRCLDETRKLIEKSGLNRELLPETIGLTGRTHQRMKHWNRALNDYVSAAQESASQGLLEQQFRWLGKEAMTRLNMRDEPNGIAKLEESIELGRSLLAAGRTVAEELSLQIPVLAGATESRDRERAEELWQETWQLLDRLPRSRSHFYASINYAASLDTQDKRYVASTHLEEAVEIGRELGLDVQERYDLSRRLAGMLAQMNEHERAGDLLMQEYEEALDAAHPLQAKHDLLTSAVDNYFSGRCWSKMKTAASELRQFRKLGGSPAETHKGLVDVEARYAIACHELGHLDDALSALNSALEHALALGDRAAISKARGETAIVLVEKGDYGEAAKIGYEVWSEGRRDGLTARTLLRALIGAGELDRAAAFKDEYAQPGPDQLDELAIAYSNALLADAGRGNPVDEWYAVGQAAARQRNGAVQEEALTRLYRLYPTGSKEQFEASRGRLRLIEPVRERVADIFSESAWQSVSLKAKEFPGYLDEFLRAALAAGRDHEAMYELERFRAQALVNVIAERSALWNADGIEGGTPGNTSADKYLRARYALVSLVARGASWQARRQAAREVDAAKNTARATAGPIDTSAGRGLHFPANLQQHLSGASLGAGEELIFLHPLPDRSALWAVDSAGSITRAEIPSFNSSDAVRLRDILVRGRDDGRAVRGRWRDLEPEERVPDLIAVLEDLEETLGKPLASWLKSRGTLRIFLVAGAAVTSLPIDWCPSSVESSVEFCFLPTGKAFSFSRAVRRPPVGALNPVADRDRDRIAARCMTAPRGQTLLVVDPTRTLEFASMEAAMVAHSAAGAGLHIIDRDAVSKTELASAAGAVEILHIIGHGTFNDQSPYRSGMYIDRRADADALWTNAEVFSQVQAPAGRLVVLSGCETGRTLPNLVSEEVSLPAAFLAAGFSTVIGSRWPVDDLSTTLLMGDFYARWKRRDVSAATALKESAMWLRMRSRDEVSRLIRGLPEQLRAVRPEKFDEWTGVCSDAASAIRSGAEYPFSDPNSWAAFFVVGDGAITSSGPDSRVPPFDG